MGQRKLTVKDVFGVLFSRFKVGAMAHLTDGTLGKEVCGQGWAYDLTMRRGRIKHLNRWIYAQARKLRAAGFYNWGMNLLFAENDRLDEDFRVILRIKPGWVTISAVATPGDFKKLASYAKRLRDAGIYFGILVGSEQHLRLLLRSLPAELYPDFVILEGCESGGHNGPCTLLELLMTCLKTLKEHNILVGAAGKVTPELLEKLFAMGVDFVQIGTPVAVSEESPAHRLFKEAACKASSTVQTGSGKYNHATRGMPTAGALRVLELERQGVCQEEWNAATAGMIYNGLMKGDPEGAWLIGDGVRRIKKIRPLVKILGEYTVDEEPSEVA